MPRNFPSDSMVQQNAKRILAQVGDAARKAGRRPEDVRVMAVTKTVPPELVNEAIAAGISLLGENRAQELRDKFEFYNKEQAEIHFIGQLQTNKVKYIVDKVSMIHSVDSLRLAQEISRQCQKRGKTMEILLEVNAAEEETKAGISKEQVLELAEEIAQLPFVSIRGLMTIPPPCEDISRQKHYFSQIQQLSVDIKRKNIDNISMDILSMGMSMDYIPAIEMGSNIIRLGTALFGSRS